MKVLEPTNSNHSITLIPRYYPSDEVVMLLKNITTEVEIEIVLIYVVSNGLMTFTFDFDFENKYQYSFILKENTNILYRGNILLSNQEPQSYKQTNLIYE